MSYKEKTFYYKNLEVSLLIPKKPNSDMNWVFKCDYKDDFKELDESLLESGYHIVYIRNVSRWAYMKDLITKGELAFYLNTNYSLSFKFSLLGYGSGGAIALRFAELYPEFISSVVLDSPVVDFISCPGKIHDSYSKKSWMKEFNIVYPKEDLITLESSEVNPKNSLNILNEYNIPVVILFSDEDDITPFNENGKLIVDAYDDKNNLKIIKKSSLRHAVFGEKSKVKEITDFIIEHDTWEEL